MITLFRQYPIVIAETGPFRSSAKKLVGEDELAHIIGHIAFHPEGGDVIVGTGGVRKMRWSRPGMGKSGGLRIIYFFHDLNMPLYLLAVYLKSDKENITDQDKQDMQKLTKTLVRTWRDRSSSKKKEKIQWASEKT